MRGRPTNAMRWTRGVSFDPAPDDHPILDRNDHQIVMAARQALVNTIEQYCRPGLDPRALRMVAISGLFADAIQGLAHTTAAPKLIQVINQQLASAGLEIVPMKRN